MDGMRPQSAAASYFQLGMGWMMRGIAFVTTTPEALKKTGSASINLLEGFRWESETVNGQVDPARVRDLMKQVMDPIKSFYRAGLVVTCALFFASRVVSIFPIVPSLFLLFSIVTGMITWDLHATLREVNHAHSYFNVLAKSSGKGIDFDELVKAINEYSQRILSNTWIISGFNPIEDSLTDCREHLKMQIKNQTEGGKTSPLEIAQSYFPIVGLIYRVAHAADKVY